MPKIVTTKEMQALENAADAQGLSFDEMIQNAGKTIADVAISRLGKVEGKRVVILAGKGNNGGDGLVAALHLANAGAQVSVYLSEERTEDDELLKPLQDMQLLVAVYADDQRSRVLRNILKSADVVIDSILGTGVQLPLKGAVKEVLSKTQQILSNREALPYVIAVDCPSGLDCDTGEIADEALKADLTITLAAAKPGLISFPGAEYVGELVIGDIGLPPRLKELSKINLDLQTAESTVRLLPQRPIGAHKGTFGRVLIVAGSINYPGAAVLAGVAAYRSGVGLVTLAVPASIQSMLVPTLPEATWILLPHEMGALNENGFDIIAKEYATTQTMLIGPGLGQDDATLGLLSKLFRSAELSDLPQIGFLQSREEMSHRPNEIPPCVVDADGLNLLAKIDNWSQLLPAASILTPHPGEMATLTGRSKDEIQQNRVAAAREFAKAWGHVVTLKGAFTVVASPDGRASVMPIATAALARAGTGDVLAGVIAGFRAQGLEAYDAAVAGSYIHARAGEFAAQSLGTEASVLAGEVAEALPNVIAELAAQ